MRTVVSFPHALAQCRSWLAKNLPDAGTRASHSTSDAALEVSKSKSVDTAAICNALATTADGNLGERFFLDVLRRHFGEQDAQRQLELAIDWGRYGELYEYDASSGQLIRDHGLVRRIETAPS